MIITKNNYLILFLLVLATACNRNPPQQKEEEVLAPGEIADNSDPSNITAEEPFRNQPNEFCTIIRRLEAEYYSPGKTLDEHTSYPKKYCLLDVCLDHINNDAMIINLGDSTNVASATYAIIKIFDTTEEAKAYEIKYGIKDVVYEN